MILRWLAYFWNTSIHIFHMNNRFSDVWYYMTLKWPWTWFEKMPPYFFRNFRPIRLQNHWVTKINMRCPILTYRAQLPLDYALNNKIELNFVQKLINDKQVIHLHLCNTEKRFIKKYHVWHEFHTCWKYNLPRDKEVCVSHLQSF